MSESSAPSTVEPFVISQVFDGPRDLVFRAFTDTEHMRHWWGPKGFTVISQTMDLRPGGMYHYGLKAPDGSTMWGRMIYREIAAPERIVFINSFSDEKCGLERHPLRTTWPIEMLSTITFEDVGAGRTKLTVTWMPHNASEIERETFDTGRESMTGGWTGTFDQLAAHLASVKEKRG